MNALPRDVVADQDPPLKAVQLGKGRANHRLMMKTLNDFRHRVMGKRPVPLPFDLLQTRNAVSLLGALGGERLPKMVCDPEPRDRKEPRPHARRRSESWRKFQGGQKRIGRDLFSVLVSNSPKAENVVGHVLAVSPHQGVGLDSLPTQRFSLPTPPWAFCPLANRMIVHRVPPSRGGSEGFPKSGKPVRWAERRGIG